MGLRVEKSNKSFLPQFKDHRRKLASRQHSEREERVRRRVLDQATERDRRAVSRAPTTVETPQQEKERQEGETSSEDESVHNIPGPNSPKATSQRREHNPLSSIKFRKLDRTGEISQTIKARQPPRTDLIEMNNCKQNRITYELLLQVILV